MHVTYFLNITVKYLYVFIVGMERKIIKVDMQDFIDIALVIQGTKDADVLEFYLGLLADTIITPDDFARYEEWSDSEYVGDSLNELELVLKEMDLWDDEAKN